MNVYLKKKIKQRQSTNVHQIFYIDFQKARLKVTFEPYSIDVLDF